jgi:hypothetical protein
LGGVDLRVSVYFKIAQKPLRHRHYCNGLLKLLTRTTAFCAAFRIVGAGLDAALGTTALDATTSIHRDFFIS